MLLLDINLRGLSRLNPDGSCGVDGFHDLFNHCFHDNIFFLQWKGRDEGEERGEDADTDGLHFCNWFLIMSV